jgi:hypothetical protein
MESLEPRQMLSITVDTLDDENDGINTGGVSLRDAVAHVATLTGPQTIEFDSELADGTIELTEGEITITSDVTIRGLGRDSLSIDALGDSRVFRIDWAQRPQSVT